MHINLDTAIFYVGNLKGDAYTAGWEMLQWHETVSACGTSLLGVLYSGKH